MRHALRFLSALAAALAATAPAVPPAVAQTAPKQNAPKQSAPAQNAPAQNAPAKHAPAPNTASLPSDGGTGWRVECANDGKALDCRAINRVSHRETRELIAAVALRIPPDIKKPVVTVQLPLGIQVTDQITLPVDDGKPERYPIQTCTQTGCLAGAPASDALLGTLRGGRELKVAFHSLANQTITVTMPLAGFALAWDKVK
jgi:invasion protein IalB